jgi:hypothetical protein
MKSSRRWLWRMASSGILRSVALVRTDVSEELSTYFIRVTRIGELVTMLIVTSKRRTLRRNTKSLSLRSLTTISNRFPYQHSVYNSGFHILGTCRVSTDADITLHRTKRRGVKEIELLGLRLSQPYLWKLSSCSPHQNLPSHKLHAGLFSGLI